MDILVRGREPAVVVMLVVLGLRIGLALALAIAAGGDSGGATGLAAYAAASQAAEPVLVAVLAGLVGCCHLRTPTPHVRVVTLVALVETVLAVLVTLVSGVLLPAGSGLTALPASLGLLNVAERLPGLAVPVLAVVALVALVRRPAAAPGPATAPSQLPGRVQQPPAELDPAPEQQPVWRPDAAAGAAWLNAGDAASGRPATGWGSGTGWDATPTPSLPQSSRPSLPEPDVLAEPAAPAGPSSEREQKQEQDPHPWATGPH